MTASSRCERSLVLLCALAFPALTACYGYREAGSLAELSPESRVRLEVLRTAERSGGNVGTRDRRRVDGHLIAVGADSVYLATERSSPGRYRVGPVSMDTIGIARGQLGRVLQREFSVWRTATLAAGSTAAVAAYVVVGFDAAGGSRPRDGPGGGVEETLVPVFSLPLPW